MVVLVLPFSVSPKFTPYRIIKQVRFWFIQSLIKCFFGVLVKFKALNLTNSPIEIGWVISDNGFNGFTFVFSKRY